MLKHRTLVIILTDLDDAAVAEQLARAVRLLSPPHLVVVAGVQNVEIAELARRRSGRAGATRGSRWPRRSMSCAPSAQRARLRRLGAPVIATKEELLESAVFAEYESLRRSRRI